MYIENSEINKNQSNQWNDKNDVDNYIKSEKKVKRQDYYYLGPPVDYFDSVPDYLKEQPKVSLIPGNNNQNQNQNNNPNPVSNPVPNQTTQNNNNNKNNNSSNTGKTNNNNTKNTNSSNNNNNNKKAATSDKNKAASTSDTNNKSSTNNQTNNNNNKDAKVEYNTSNNAKTNDNTSGVVNKGIGESTGAVSNNQNVNNNAGLANNNENNKIDGVDVPVQEDDITLGNGKSNISSTDKNGTDSGSFSSILIVVLTVLSLFVVGAAIYVRKRKLYKKESESLEDEYSDGVSFFPTFNKKTYTPGEKAAQGIKDLYQNITPGYTDTLKANSTFGNYQKNDNSLISPIEPTNFSSLNGSSSFNYSIYDESTPSYIINTKDTSQFSQSDNKIYISPSPKFSY